MRENNDDSVKGKDESQYSINELSVPPKEDLFYFETGLAHQFSKIMVNTIRKGRAYEAIFCVRTAAKWRTLYGEIKISGPSQLEVVYKAGKFLEVQLSPEHYQLNEK